MKRLVLIFALLCALPASAAISFVDKCTAATTSCTVPAHLPGDLMIAFAAVNSTSTAPTNPSGWTSAGGTACAAGSTTCTINGTSTADSAVRTSCKIANGTTNADDTATGFTSATSLIVLIYRGTGIMNAGKCGAIAQIVWTATTVNTTSVTETFATVTNAASTSWNVGAGYAPAATAGMSTAPGTMANRAAQGTIQGGHDVGPVASFSTANVTITTTSRIITAVLELTVPGTLAACTGSPCPTLVQHADWGTNDGGMVGSIFKFHLPQATGASNLLICAVSWDVTSVTATITDNNGGNTWVAGPTSNDGTRVIALRYVLGVAAGTQDLTVTLSTAEYNFKFSCSEFYNVATSSAVDGTATSVTTAGGASTVPLASGSITTTTNNDLIYYSAIDNSSLSATIAAQRWLVGDGFNKLSANRTIPWASQYVVWGSSGAINPAMMAHQIGATKDAFGSAAIAFKAASAGTAPSGIRIVRQYTHTPLATTDIVEVPCETTTNLFVAAASTTPAQAGVTAITDDNSNTWTRLTTASYPDQLYAQGATCTNPNTRIATITLSSVGVPDPVVLYEIAGAATSAYDSGGSNMCTSTQTNKAANPTTCTNDVNVNSTCSATPSTANGLYIVSENNGQGPEACTFGTNNVGDMGWFSGEDDQCCGSLNSSSGYGHIHYTSTAQQTFTFGWTNSAAGAPSGWAMRMTSFKELAGAAGVRKRVISSQH